ncbi:MAG: hypothetical protein A4E28_03187 [Methanocella sp. PtaU1.Bin125]|nr:MAG: hypothetical protein A4E28_03187 [Methanocella sp. PtaU1.Bin125]
MRVKTWRAIAVLSLFCFISVIVSLTAAVPAQAHTAILTPNDSGDIIYNGTGTHDVPLYLTISATVPFPDNYIVFNGVHVQKSNHFSITVSPVESFSVSVEILDIFGQKVWFPLDSTMNGNTGSFARGDITPGTYNIKIDAPHTASSVSVTLTSKYVPDEDGNYIAVFNTAGIPDGVYSIKQDGVEVAKAYVGLEPYTINFYNEWNLISIPLTLESNDLSDIFPADVLSHITDIWGWDESVQDWIYYSINPNDYFYQYYPKITELETGRAYWVRMEGTASVTVAGTVPSCAPDSPVALVNEWNCVGLTDMSPVPVTTMYPGATDIWGWDPVAQDWVYYSIDPNDYFYQYYPKINNIMPGNGYWVRME